MVARIIGAKLGEYWGQTVVVENRAGATGTIGADIVAKSPPDGYTLIMGHVNSHGIAPNLFKKLPYDAQRDFAMVAYVGYVPNVLVVHPSIPAKSVKELIAIAKAKPGSSTTPRPASAARSTSRARCSSSPPASISCTFRTRAAARRWSIFSPATWR